MRHRLTSQVVRQSTDICIFCSRRWSAETPAVREGSHLAKRTYTSSAIQRTPAGAAVARKEDDYEYDFPLLKQNAVATAGIWSTSRPVDRSAPLPRAPEPEPRFSIRGSRNNRPPVSNFENRRGNTFGLRDGKQEQPQRQSVQSEKFRPRGDDRFGSRDDRQHPFGRGVQDLMTSKCEEAAGLVQQTGDKTNCKITSIAKALGSVQIHDLVLEFHSKNRMTRLPHIGRPTKNSTTTRPRVARGALPYAGSTWLTMAKTEMHEVGHSYITSSAAESR